MSICFVDSALLGVWQNLFVEDDDDCDVNLIDLICSGNQEDLDTERHMSTILAFRRLGSSPLKQNGCDSDVDEKDIQASVGDKIRRADHNRQMAILGKSFGLRPRSNPFLAQVVSQNSLMVVDVFACAAVGLQGL
jgi:hypothetical protein